MKVKLNPAIEEFRGSLGELVFREVNGKVVAGRKARVTADPTEGQLQHRARFKQAAAYGKTVMANPVVRPLYEAAAKVRKMPIYSVIVADYFNAPTIHSIDLSQYTVQPDSIITVLASDDIEVTEVQVIITNDQDALIESGFAAETAPGSGQWVYVAQTSSPLPTLKVKAIAKDRPGGITAKTEILERFQQG